MEPLPVQGHAEQAPGLDRAIEEEVEREGALRRVVEQLRLHDRGASIDVGRQRPEDAAREAPVRIHVEVAQPVVAEALPRREKQQDVHLLRPPGLEEARQVLGLTLRPERIGVEDEEFGAEERQRALDPASRLQERVAFVGDRDGEVGQTRDVILDHVGQVMDVDHDLAQPGLEQAPERVVDQGTSRDLHERLRPPIGDGPHALAEPGREDHGDHPGLRLRRRLFRSGLALGSRLGRDVGRGACLRGIAEEAVRDRVRLDARRSALRRRLLVSGLLLREDVAAVILEPALQARQRGMGEIAGEIGPDARQMSEVLRLAVPPVEPREYPEDLGRPLRPHDRVRGGELGHVEAGIRGFPLPAVEGQELQLEVGRHRHPCILQERGDIVGGRAQDRVLEIQEPDAPDPLPLGEPDQVGRVEVPQRPGLPAGQQPGQSVPPDMPELRPDRARRLPPDDMGQVPVEQELGLDHEGIEVVGRELMRAVLAVGKRGRKRSRVQAGEEAGRLRIPVRDRAILVDHRLAAEILEDQQTDI